MTHEPNKIKLRAGGPAPQVKTGSGNAGPFSTGAKTKLPGSARRSTEEIDAAID
jgi:hypothetical protein